MKNFKRMFVMLVSLALVLSMLLVSCDNANTPDDTSDALGSDTTVEEETTEPFVDIAPYVVEESYLPEDIANQMREMYTGKKAKYICYSVAEAPYVPSATDILTNCSLKSISLPVYKTGKVDADGNLVFTILVYKNTFDGIKSAALRSYEIKIKPEDYDLSPSKNYLTKYIDIDLTSYNIVLAEDETIGFFAKTDTLFPAYIPNNEDNASKPLALLREEFPRANGCYIKTGAGADVFEYSQVSLVFDLKWERSYEKLSVYNEIMGKEARYNEMVEALKKKYEGKYISVMGDSISTYGGICNDTTSNVTIGKNAVYYSGKNHNIFDSSRMYWGKLIADIGMKPCVINTWSGSFAYGATDGAGNMLDRAVQMHRDGGTPDNPADDIAPDVILIYFGINDLNGGRPSGDLYMRIRKAEGNDLISRVEQWYKPVKEAAAKTNGVVQGKTYTTYDQVYALSLEAMKQKYPDAEIFCMTLQESDHNNTSVEKLEKFNVVISGLAKYFGATVIDQQKDGITFDNCQAYSTDYRALHPNAIGHAKMAEYIVENMYNKMNSEK